MKAVLFDYGGVLGVEDIRRTVAGLAAAFSCSARELSAPLRTWYARYEAGALPDQQFLAGLARDLGRKPPAAVDWAGIFQDSFTRQEEVYAIGRDLRDRGYASGIITNMIPPFVRYLRASGGFDGFDPVVASCEVRARKPEEAIYRAALKRLGLRPGEVAFVDDKEQNLAAAAHLGMATLHYSSPAALAADLQRMVFSR
ncbi:MAG: HAD family phosphatase [Candidatus Aenigmarchaeota archaeon]|nr:HAD family phosphatase [Candidatus Aenigmarchaeota archaeon]